MKNRHHRNLIQSFVLATALGGTIAHAETAPASPSEDLVSGVLKLDFNTHFISYGSDIWNDGAALSDPTFNPMVELAFALPADLTFTIGTWWDMNSKADTTIGERIQEVDVWGGLAYTYDEVTVSATYQAWKYGSDIEDLIDVKFAYDCILSPSLTVHQRINKGAAVGDEGTILVLGLSHSVEAGPLSISFPFNIAYFATDDFHNPSSDGGADTGLGFASIGVAASLPLTPYIGDGFGEWALNGGATYFFTDEDVIPNNPKDSFLTASLGLSMNF